MCSPEHYGIEYSINPWMEARKGANRELALEQWRNLHHTIIRLGGFVEYIVPQPGLPDMVFTANAGLVRGKKFFMSRFKYKERRGEEHYFQSWFSKRGFSIVACGGCMEGAGDALFVGDTLFAAHGFRSDKSVWPVVGKELKAEDIVVCKLVDPYFYHLDTCFCPLDDENVIFYPGAFKSPKKIIKNVPGKVFEVPEKEARQFACNAVVIEDNIIMPAGCDQTAEWLAEKQGFNVYMVPMSEFIKAGGACKCLTLKL